MKNLSQLSDMQVYMLWVEMKTMSEDGDWDDYDDIQDEYLDLLGVIQQDLSKRGYEDEQAIEDKFGYIYDNDHRRYH